MKKEVGIIIKVCRQYHGFTQVYMAHRLGITVNSYANIEHGRVDMGIDRLFQLSKIFRIKAYQILSFAEKTYTTKDYRWVPSAIRGVLVGNYQIVNSNID